MAEAEDFVSDTGGDTEKTEVKNRLKEIGVGELGELQFWNGEKILERAG